MLFETLATFSPLSLASGVAAALARTVFSGLWGAVCLSSLHRPLINNALLDQAFATYAGMVRVAYIEQTPPGYFVDPGKNNPFLQEGRGRKSSSGQSGPIFYKGERSVAPTASVHEPLLSGNKETMDDPPLYEGGYSESADAHLPRFIAPRPPIKNLPQKDRKGVRGVDVLHSAVGGIRAAISVVGIGLEVDGAPVSSAQTMDLDVADESMNRNTAQNSGSSSNPALAVPFLPLSPSPAAGGEDTGGSLTTALVILPEEEDEDDLVETERVLREAQSQLRNM